MRKLFLSLLLIISFISHALCSYAIDIGSYELYSKGVCDYLLNYKGSARITEFVVYNKNQKEYPAYCLNVEKKGVDSSHGYSVNVTDKYYDLNVWRTILSGYPYKSISELGVATQEEAYTATKQAIYIAQGVRDLGDYSAFDSDAGRRTYNALVNIVTNARNSSAVQPGIIDIDISTEDVEWKYANGYVEKEFEIKSNINSGTYNVNLLGQNLPEGTQIVNINDQLQSKFANDEKFKIRIPVQSLKSDGTITIKCELSSHTFPILYGVSGTEGAQDYALTYESVEVESFEYEINYKKNLTKINILKKEYESEKTLENVEFELSDKKSYNKQLITDKEGKASEENLMPGKYYLKEIKTLDGYNIITDEIEVNVEYNEEVNITVNNTKINKEIFEKKYENVEVTTKENEKKVETVVDNNYIENEYTYVKTKANTAKKLLPKTGY